MGRVEKTVFISYRRTNLPWALAIYQNLIARDYDVFFDYQSLSSGDFEQVLLENIKARAHFIVLLTPSALERCDEPGDWLRREIETAITTKRNIVPLLLENFDFSSPSTTKYLTGKLELLKNYNGLRIHLDYFEEGMVRLRERYLNTLLTAVLHPLSDEVQQVTQEQQETVNNVPIVKEKELSAQKWFEKGYESKDTDEKIHCYSEAIKLNPRYAQAYTNRGFAFCAKGDANAAINDYGEAILLSPDTAADAFYGRGCARMVKHNYEGAIKDFTDAIRLRAEYPEAYSSRGDALCEKDNQKEAIKDYSEAIRIKPDFAEAYSRRGSARKDLGELDAAIKDYTEAIRLNPNDADACLLRGIALNNKGELNKAIEDYTKAIHIRRDFANAYKDRASAWNLKEDYYAALFDYKTYLELGGGEKYGDRKMVEDIIRRLQAKLKQ